MIGAFDDSLIERWVGYPMIKWLENGLLLGTVAMVFAGNMPNPAESGDNLQGLRRSSSIDKKSRPA
jgi:hypothetical protein